MGHTLTTLVFVRLSRRYPGVRRIVALAPLALQGDRASPRADLQGDAKKATIAANYASFFVCGPISRLSPSRAWAVAAPARRVFARPRNRAADGAACRHVDAGTEASCGRWTSHA